MRKLMVNTTIYVVLYVLVMIPTYILPYFGSNSHMIRGVVSGINRDMGNSAGASLLSGVFFVHLACLLLLCAFAHGRGKVIGRPALLVFPGLALAFDMLPGLSLIPLVPTGLHLAAVILGVTWARTSVASASPISAH